MVILYTKENCVQCSMTKRMMDKLGLEYETINISDYPEELDKLISLGYRAAPVVITDDGESFAGFQPDKIMELAS